MWEFIRNIINPKEERPEHCLCPEDDFRYWSSIYSGECPVHKHHVEDQAFKV